MSSYTPADREAEYQALLAAHAVARPEFERRAAAVARGASERIQRRREGRYIERKQAERRTRKSSSTTTDREVT